jgi:hypothetical protein
MIGTNGACSLSVIAKASAGNLENMRAIQTERA